MTRPSRDEIDAYLAGEGTRREREATERDRAARTGKRYAYLVPETPVLHRHADGTEHTHGGSDNAVLRGMGQNAPDAYGDDPHTHGSLSLVTGSLNDDTSGPVIWSERHP